MGIFLNWMDRLGTSSTGSALQLTDSVRYEEHLALLWLVLTRPGSELSTIYFVWFLIHLEIFWQNMGIFLNQMNRLEISSTGSALQLTNSINYEEHLALL